MLLNDGSAHSINKCDKDPIHIQKNLLDIEITMGEKSQIRRRHGQIAVFARAVSYVIYLTFPVHAAMMAVGFIHKERCPADVRLPRFLFFGGLAGLMAVLLR